MGISDDIHRKVKPKPQLDEIPVVDSSIKQVDVSDIIEPLPDTIEGHKDITPDNASFFAPDKSKTKKLNNKTKSFWLLVLLILLVLLLVSVAVYQNLDVIKRKILKTPETTTTTSSVKEVAATTDTALTSDTQESTQATTPTATTPTTTPVAITNNSFTIRVSNGNGIKGSADKVRDILSAAGFNVISVGNATNYNYATTIVYYKTGQETQANLVKSALSSRIISTELSTTLSAYDVLVVVGSK